ncbi:hypothetical protein BG015_006069 [Linnemannia schmuckeri]|uniref:BZIP domain-containing protein n=1 Tax=Linnemannia schmuckeri TaxID=64567 RepID=A0A9P5S3P1_9FUNG|nr:hypothetical protein BG015_006069 [Linnemannia schmuckeri]
MGSGAEPGPGPAPPPSLTLPPLRELDKVIRPDSSSSSSHRGSAGLGLMGGPGGQPRSQFTDPHLHQHSSHSHSQQSMQQHHYQQQQQQQQQQRGPHSHSFPQHPSSSSSSSHGAGSQQYYSHDHHSRHSSSVGSLPDLYMSSSGAPSTTTTSSLSRTDSLSSIEYLHGSHPLHSHAHRHLSGSVSGSTTTGSTTGSSFGHSVASGSVSSGGSNSVYLHHSTGLGRANLNAAIHHQRNPRDSATSSTTGSGDASSPATATNGSHAANGKSGSTTSGSAGTEQGRNSTKRAAQNRAAQRAFRQRKDLYVRELERKAELLQQAEGKILRLTARNRELEVALAANNPSSSSSLSPQQSPLHSHASPTTGLVCAAGTSSEQDQQQQPNHTLHHSSSREQLDRGDRERGASGSEWSRDEKPSSLSSRDQEFCDDNSSTHSGHSYPSSLARATLGRRSVSQPMRSAYNASTPPLTNDSLKFHSLKQQLAANQHLNQPHSLPRHSQQQQHPSRTDSDYEFEGLDHPTPHRQLHRHPSEPSLNKNRHGSNSGDSGDDYATSGVQPYRQNTYPHDENRNHGARRSSVDSRMELTSPVFNNHQSASSSTFRPSNNITNAGNRSLPSEYPESSSPPSSTQLYTANGSVQHERPPLYPITTQGGSRSASLGSARSWSGAQQEDGIKPHSPMMTSPVAGLSRGSIGGGMVTSAASPTRDSGGYSRGNDMEYLSDERSETGSGFDAMNKRSSDGAISWSGSNSSGGRGGGPPGPEPQSSSLLAYHNNASSRGGDGLGLRKENSWSSFSAVNKGNSDGYNGGGGPSPMSLPPVSALAGAAQREMEDDMEMQDSYHHPRSTQHLQQQQQHRDSERRPSGSEISATHHRGSMAMMSDSPEMGSSDTRLLNNNNASTTSVTTPQMSGRQQQYFLSQQQQQHRASPFAPQQHHQHQPMKHLGGGGGGHHPLSPANEYPPGPGGAAAGSDMDGVYEQQQHYQQPRYNNHSGGIATGHHEETMMRSP